MVTKLEGGNTLTENKAITSIDIHGVVSGTATAEMDGKYLSFWLNDQLFAVEIADVVQIVGVQTITDLPESPIYVKGIINLRGSIIPVIDVRLRIGKPEREYDERTCIIVTNIHDTLIGLVVDAVNEVTDIDSENISPPPQMHSDCASTYLTGIAKQEKGVVLLISTQKLLGETEVVRLSEGAIENMDVAQ